MLTSGDTIVGMSGMGGVVEFDEDAPHFVAVRSKGVGPRG
jgi:hypothetical protein